MQISVSYSHSPVFWVTDNTSVRKLGSFTSLHWPLKDNRGLISFFSNLLYTRWKQLYYNVTTTVFPIKTYLFCSDDGCLVDCKFH